MYEILRNLLSDKNNGILVFEAFSLCHILFLIFLIGGIVLTLVSFKNKSQEAKNKLINLLYEIRPELVKEKNRIVNLEIEIRDKYKKHMEEEIRELWNNEIEFKEAKELYSELAVKGGIYEIAQI